MSCYNWEAGTLVLPTKAWKPFRDSLMVSFNKLQTSKLAWLTSVHANVLAQKKLAKRGQFELTEALRDIVQRKLVPYPSIFERDEDFDLVYKLISPSGALVLPKKKDFPLATSATKGYDAGYSGSIILDAQSRKVHWKVSDNNRAVESAWDSAMGTAFHQALGKVVWTRATGGVFIGNDEYNRDSDCAGGGGNYVTSRFGPLGEAGLEGRRPTRRSTAR